MRGDGQRKKKSKRPKRRREAADLFDVPKSMHLSYDERIVNGYYNETWLNHALFTDSYQADELRIRMHSIAQKSRTYHHNILKDFLSVSYDTTGTSPRPY